MARNEIVAAGAVCWRDRGGQREVALVHRNRYDDWSIPKGKVERGETFAEAAVREVAEEAGMAVALGPPLPAQRYTVNGRPKLVHYWAAGPISRTAPFVPEHEVDQVQWWPLEQAAQRLSYRRDADLLDHVARLPRTAPLIVVRHAEAVPRQGFHGAHDGERPLSERGQLQAAALVGWLSAYQPTHVITSDWVRCQDTVAPFCAAVGVTLDLEPALSEEGAARPALEALVARLAAELQPVLLCTHRPVLPQLGQALAELLRPGPIAGWPRWTLPVGGAVVLHRFSQGVVAVERHEPGLTG